MTRRPASAPGRGGRKRAPAKRAKAPGKKGGAGRRPAATRSAAPDRAASGPARPSPGARALAVAGAGGALASEGDALEPRIAGPADAATEALGRLRTLETIEDAYQAWAELRALERQARAAWAEERARIEGQGAFLLGAVRAARDFSRPLGAQEAPLARSGGEVDAYIAQTQARLTAARQKLDGDVAAAEQAWAQALAEAKDTVRARVERTARLAPPALRLLLRTLAQGRRILHLERLSGDAPALAHAVLSGTIPSRYDFLFDDSTDDVGLPPAPLYSEEGVAAAEARCAPERLVALLDSARARGVFPSKGMIPCWVVQPAGALLVRFLQRGPVAEAEVPDGAGWRSVLSAEEAELIAGWLIKLQLEGKLAVALARG